jgi:hypothetical protein
LPVRRPDSDPLLWGLVLSAVASQGLVLYFMRRVAAYAKSAPLIESIDACLVSMVVASLGGIGCWFAVTSGSVAPGWADTLLIAAAAGGTVAFAWIGQTAGYVRSQLR